MKGRTASLAAGLLLLQFGTALAQYRVGDKVSDFSLPDLGGKTRKLSICKVKRSVLGSESNTPIPLQY